MTPTTTNRTMTETKAQLPKILPPLITTRSSLRGSLRASMSTLMKSMTVQESLFAGMVTSVQELDEHLMMARTLAEKQDIGDAATNGIASSSTASTNDIRGTVTSTAPPGRSTTSSPSPRFTSVPVILEEDAQRVTDVTLDDITTPISTGTPPTSPQAPPLRTATVPTTTPTSPARTPTTDLAPTTTETYPSPSPVGLVDAEDEYRREAALYEAELARRRAQREEEAQTLRATLAQQEADMQAAADLDQRERLARQAREQAAREEAARAREAAARLEAERLTAERAAARASLAAQEAAELLKESRRRASQGAAAAIARAWRGYVQSDWRRQRHEAASVVGRAVRGWVLRRAGEAARRQAEARDAVLMDLDRALARAGSAFATSDDVQTARSAAQAVDVDMAKEVEARVSRHADRLAAALRTCHEVAARGGFDAFTDAVTAATNAGWHVEDAEVAEAQTVFTGRCATAVAEARDAAGAGHRARCKAAAALARSLGATASEMSALEADAAARAKALVTALGQAASASPFHREGWEGACAAATAAGLERYVEEGQRRLTTRSARVSAQLATWEVGDTMGREMTQKLTLQEVRGWLAEAAALGLTDVVRNGEVRVREAVQSITDALVLAARTGTESEWAYAQDTALAWEVVGEAFHAAASTYAARREEATRHLQEMATRGSERQVRAAARALRGFYPADAPLPASVGDALRTWRARQAKAQHALMAHMEAPPTMTTTVTTTSITGPAWESWAMARAWAQVKEAVRAARRVGLTALAGAVGEARRLGAAWQAAVRAGQWSSTWGLPRPGADVVLPFLVTEEVGDSGDGKTERDAGYVAGYEDRDAAPDVVRAWVQDLRDSRASGWRNNSGNPTWPAPRSAETTALLARHHRVQTLRLRPGVGMTGEEATSRPHHHRREHLLPVPTPTNLSPTDATSLPPPPRTLTVAEIHAALDGQNATCATTLCLREVPYTSLGGTLDAQSLNSLTTLDLDGCSLDSLHGIGTLPALLSLSVRRNRLVDLDGALRLPNRHLTHLALDDNRLALSDAAAGRDATWACASTLTHLSLAGNQLTHLPRAPLPALRHLSVARNPLSPGDWVDAGWARGCPALESLDVSRCLLTSLSITKHLPRVLVASHNVLPSVPEFSSPLLSELWLDRNLLVGLSPAPSALHLRSLHLQENELVRLPPLGAYPALTTLDVSFNHILDLDAISHLAAAPSLRSLRLLENPAAEDPTYHATVRRYVPWLSELDHEPVTREARGGACWAALREQPLAMGRLLTSLRHRGCPRPHAALAALIASGEGERVDRRGGAQEAEETVFAVRGTTTATNNTDTNTLATCHGPPLPGDSRFALFCGALHALSWYPSTVAACPPQPQTTSAQTNDWAASTLVHLAAAQQDQVRASQAAVARKARAARGGAPPPTLDEEPNSSSTARSQLSEEAAALSTKHLRHLDKGLGSHQYVQVVSRGYADRLAAARAQARGNAAATLQRGVRVWLAKTQARLTQLAQAETDRRQRREAALALRREAAASVLAAGAHGHVVRREAGARLLEARRGTATDRLWPGTGAHDVDGAARRVQALFRGHLVRQRLRKARLAISRGLPPRLYPASSSANHHGRPNVDAETDEDEMDDFLRDFLVPPPHLAAELDLDFDIQNKPSQMDAQEILRMRASGGLRESAPGLLRRPLPPPGLVAPPATTIMMTTSAATATANHTTTHAPTMGVSSTRAGVPPLANATAVVGVLGGAAGAAGAAPVSVPAGARAMLPHPLGLPGQDAKLAVRLRAEAAVREAVLRAKAKAMGLPPESLAAVGGLDAEGRPTASSDVAPSPTRETPGPSGGATPITATTGTPQVVASGSRGPGAPSPASAAAASPKPGPTYEEKLRKLADEWGFADLKTAEMYLKNQRKKKRIHMQASGAMAAKFRDPTARLDRLKKALTHAPEVHEVVRERVHGPAFPMHRVGTEDMVGGVEEANSPTRGVVGGRASHGTNPTTTSTSHPNHHHHHHQQPSPLPFRSGGRVHEMLETSFDASPRRMPPPRGGERGREVPAAVGTNESVGMDDLPIVGLSGFALRGRPS